MTAEGCELTIRGLIRAYPLPGEAGERLLGERRTGAFERIVRLPLGTDPAGRLSASLRDGQLIVQVPVICR